MSCVELLGFYIIYTYTPQHGNSFRITFDVSNALTASFTYLSTSPVISTREFKTRNYWNLRNVFFSRYLS